MAELYLRSTDGSDSDNGSTWALAKASFAGIAAIDANGDVVYISQSHEENIGATAVWTFTNSTLPVSLIGTDDTAEPPTAPASTKPKINVTGASTLSFQGNIYINNIEFNVGNSASTTNLAFVNGTLRMRNCTINIGATSSGAFRWGSNADIESCTIKFSGANNGIVGYVGGYSILKNVTVDPASTSITTFMPLQAGENVDVIACDLSGLTSTCNLTNYVAGRVAFIGCKLPASWTGQLCPGILKSGRVSLYSSDNAANSDRLWIQTYAGAITSDTATYASGETLSWKFVSATYCVEEFTLDSDWVDINNTDIGVSKTLTVEILHDSTTALTDAEIWVELAYSKSTATPVQGYIKDKRSTIFTSAAAQDSSTESWTHSMTNPNKQKLSVTFTPEMAGPISARICMGKPSYTLYVKRTPSLT